MNGNVDGICYRSKVWKVKTFKTLTTYAIGLCLT